MTILVIEDEVKLVEIISIALGLEYYTVDVAYSGEEGLSKALKSNYTLILLDIMLPKMNGLDVCEELRKSNVQTPIIMLTAMGSMENRVAGLDIGADDYLVKPFGVEELLSRIRAVIRRPRIVNSPIYKLADLVVDTAKHEVSRAGKYINLATKEYQLLDTLIRRQGQAITRRELIDNLWGPEYKEANNELNVHIKYLRRKIDEDFKTQLIRTVRGVGYMIKE